MGHKVAALVLAKHQSRTRKGLCHAEPGEVIRQCAARRAKGRFIGGTQLRADAVRPDDEVGIERIEIGNALVVRHPYAKLFARCCSTDSRLMRGMAPPPAPGFFMTMGCS
jgi:hypothetical protein